MSYNFIELTLPPSEDIPKELLFTILIEDIQVLWENPDGTCSIELNRKSKGDSEIVQVSEGYRAVILSLHRHAKVEIV